MTVPLIGYADRLSVRPEETISFHVSHSPAATATTPAATVQTSLVRVVCADSHTPTGGIQTEPLDDATIETLREPSACTTQLGSHAECPLTEPAAGTCELLDDLVQVGFTFVCSVMPTLRKTLVEQKHVKKRAKTTTTTHHNRQTIASIPGYFTLFLDDRGRLCFALNDAIMEDTASSNNNNPALLVASETPLPLRRWSKVACTLDPGEQCTATVSWQGLDDPHHLATPTNRCLCTKQVVMTHDWLNDLEGTLILAASRVPCSSKSGDGHPPHHRYESHFNGRMEYPQLWITAQPRILEWTGIWHDEPPPHSEDGVVPPPPQVCQWDFSLDITTQRIRNCATPDGEDDEEEEEADKSGDDISTLSSHQTTTPTTNPYDGILVNGPTRACKGSRWNGTEQAWKHAPRHYSAIHFHETDFTDSCRDWPVCYAWTIPAGLKSGNYALLLQVDSTDSDCHRDNIPFFVVAPKGQPQAPLAVLVSTFTYAIYGNHARGEWLEDPHWADAWKKETQGNNEYPCFNPREYPEYGYSTYNKHADGSGVSLTTWNRRPLLNMRLGYITFPYPDKHASGLRHYPADTHLTAWLESQGIAYDIVTDWELHTEGCSVLEPYRVLVTGSHPEYHSEASWNALRDYRNTTPGRFMYLGGNGFYWKIAVSEADGLLEIRRGEGGIRAWASEPGEYYHQLDGQYGGLWRRNGRAPQALAGVGFSAQGGFEGSHYKLKLDARLNPRTSWMFDGLKTSTGIIGDHGLSGHGAAGFELDRADVRLGTPVHTVVIGSSENHSPDSAWTLVFEGKSFL